MRIVAERYSYLGFGSLVVARVRSDRIQRDSINAGGSSKIIATISALCFNPTIQSPEPCPTIKKEWAELEIIPIIETPSYGNLARADGGVVNA